MFKFLPNYKKLSELLLDQKLAKLGDAFVNFLYSLALSKKNGEATGVKVKGRFLADALKKSGLRDLLPSRIDRHKQADATEALIVYAWLMGSLTLEKGLEILENGGDEVQAFTSLLIFAKRKIKL